MKSETAVSVWFADEPDEYSSFRYLFTAFLQVFLTQCFFLAALRYILLKSWLLPPLLV